MQDGQLDLFAGAGSRHADPSPPPRASPDPTPVAEPLDPTPVAELLDAALIAAIPDAGLANCRVLAGEAARRRLAAAVPALEALCRRFKGFGLHHAIPEQTAALEALAGIGGPDAVAALRHIIVGAVMQGPGLRDAVRAAAALRCILPEATTAALLQHADPEIRASACRCAPGTGQVAGLLASLLEDLNQGVAVAAAKSLGRMGRTEARPWLTRLLRQHPDEELVEAIWPVADEECVVLLGRVERQIPALSDAVRAALEAIDMPRAAALLAALERQDRAVP